MVIVLNELIDFRRVGPQTSLLLSFFHVFSCCDQTSTFNGHVKSVDGIRRDDWCIFASLTKNSTEQDVKSSMPVLKWFVVIVYARASASERSQKVLFAQKGRSLESNRRCCSPAYKGSSLPSEPSLGSVSGIVARIAISWWLGLGPIQLRFEWTAVDRFARSFLDVGAKRKRDAQEVVNAGKQKCLAQHYANVEKTVSGGEVHVRQKRCQRPLNSNHVM